MTDMSTSPRYAVFCDLDGTLLDGAGRVTPFTSEALRAFAAAGHHIVFSTARSRRLGSIGDDLRRISTSFILHNGGELIWQGESIATHCFPAAEAREIGAALTRAGICAAVILEHDYYANYDAPAVWGDISGFHRTDFADIDVDVPKFTFYFPEGRRGPFPQDIAARGQLELTDRRSTGVLAPPGVCKGAAIREMVRLAGLECCKTIAIGNDVIDLTAFEACDIAAAVANAEPQVLAAADVVIGSNAADGVARYLLELMGVR